MHFSEKMRSVIVRHPNTGLMGKINLALDSNQQSSDSKVSNLPLDHQEGVTSSALTRPFMDKV